MPSVERTVTVDQPIEKVWAYLSDFRNTEEWDPPTVRTERVSGDGTQGTTYHNVSRLLGSEQEVTYVVTEHEVNERLQLRGGRGLDRGAGHDHAPERGRRDLGDLPRRVHPQGAAKLATPLLPAGLKVLADHVAQSLEENLRRLR